MATVVVPDELARRYAKLAEETGKTNTSYMTEVLSDAIDQLEFEYSILKDVEDYRAGKLKTYSLDEVERRLGLED